MIEKYLPRTIRILVFLLFLVSGIAKMFPLWAFEKQLVDLGLATWCSAPYFVRMLIALEIAIGITILQKHHLKKIVIPTAIFLLIIFSIHLAIEMYRHGALNGNCGCFGQLIDMSPLAAFIKNMIMLGLLIYLYRIIPAEEKGKQKSICLILILFSSLLFMFILFPFSPCRQKINLEETVIKVDSAQSKQPSSTSSEAAADIGKKTTQNKSVVSEPKKVTSRFAGYSTFGNKQVNLDEGKKIICLFAAGCDHCREAAKEIYSLSKKDNFPEVYILFMDEETNLISDFFKETGGTFPYRVVDVSKFWQAMGESGNTPGVFFLWNGNIIKFYEGVGNNKFSPEGLKKASESRDN
ncbi:MAG: hypothetical protein AUJ54_12605 [Ignavibacteria bacterium CG1_02_37_35]|nr:MAG: hypothetical protein AUJ54_12605 [Ignavibacteria bacterium CG1_02_37_35]